MCFVGSSISRLDGDASDDALRMKLMLTPEGVQTEELMEIFGVANLVGGTIVIPHTRRAMEYWEELCEIKKPT